MKRNELTEKFFPLGIFLSYFIGVLYFLRFNPDPQHDGILISSGQMVANGLTPHLDFRFIWGPLLPYILSIPLEFSPNLYALRVFGYLALCICAFQLYLLNRKIMPNANARLISAIWLISFPPLSVLSYTYWPMAATIWPNIYAFIFVLISTNILLLAVQNTSKWVSAYFFFAGFFALLSIGIRINFIVLFIVLVIYILWLYGKNKELLYFVLPSLVLIILIILFRHTSQVISWYGDTFLSLKGDTASTGVPNFTMDGLLRSMFAILLLSLLYLTTLLAIRTKKLNVKHYVRTFVSVLILVSIFAATLFVFDISGAQLINKAKPWLERSYSQIALGYLATACLLLLPLSILNFRRNFLFKKTHPNVTLLGLLAFGSIPLNHNLNIDYIWINSVFLISYISLSINLIYKWDLRRILIPSFVFCAISLLIGLLSITQANIYSFNNEPLKFMQHKELFKGKEIDEEMSLFYRIPSNSVVKNNCSDSLYMATNNKLIVAGKSLSRETNGYYLNRFEKSETDWVFECNIGIGRLKELKNKIQFVANKNNGNFSVIYKVYP